MPNIHLIGIGGAGLSAIATVLLQQGHTVSGSDIQASPTTERLAELGATIFVGHEAENIRSYTDTVVISSAIPADNPEVAAAQRLGIPIVKRAEWLGQMMRGHTGIAIAGTHGKTTTTAMIAFLLQQAGQDPTYIVGGYVPQMKTNAAAGQGRIFVIEADEYDHTFLGLLPEVAVVTTVEWDHPDIYPTPERLQEAFVDFVRLVPLYGLIIGCGDEMSVRQVVAASRGQLITYGLQPNNEWQAVDTQPNQWGGYDFQVIRHPQAFSQSKMTAKPVAVSLRLPGLHNVVNGLAALVVADYQGIDLDQAAIILHQFEGVARRFQLKGEANGVTIIDDYAHHPTAVRVTLAAARTRYPNRRLWAIFQPHTFSRTQSLLHEFAQAFEDADQVIVVDIFASREKDTGQINSREVVALMTDHPAVHYLGDLNEAVDYLSQQTTPGDVVITLGAGDGYLVGERLLAKLTATG